MKSPRIAAGADAAAPRSFGAAGADAAAPASNAPVSGRFPERQQRPRLSSAVEPQQPPPDEKRPHLEAEMKFREGLRSHQRGDYRAAAALFTQASLLHPEHLEYALHAGWAELQLGGSDPGALRGKLDRLVLAALREDRNLAFAHFVQGQLALLKKDHSVAMRAFSRVCELEPHNDDARRHYIIAKRRAEK